MRFLIFIYGKSRMKRTQLVSDKRAECHILLPKDDFSLERTVFLQFKNISGEWFIKETDCCHLKTEEFFQMGKRKSDEGIFYKLSIGRKNELSVGGKDLYIQLIRYRNDWSIYKKYKLRDCRIIKEKNIFIMMEKAINRKNSMGISYEYGKWFIEKCGNIEIYINEILLEKKQQLEFGDVICIGTIYLLFFENYIAVEAGERNIVSDYLEEVVLENEIKGQEDVRKKEKREITFHRAPRVMEELKKETAIQRISKMALISDFTVVGIGGVDTNATIIKNSILTPDDYLLLKKQGAVGDILSHFIDINGNLIDTDLEKRLMSPALTDIEKYNNVVGVAGGPHKIEAIYAVLTGKYLDVLITDENTATAVLDLYQSKNNIDTERKDGALQ